MTSQKLGKLIADINNKVTSKSNHVSSHTKIPLDTKCTLNICVEIIKNNLVTYKENEIGIDIQSENGITIHYHKFLQIIKFEQQNYVKIHQIIVFGK